MGERWKKVSDGGERSLIKAPSSASLSSQGASSAAAPPAGPPAGPPALPPSSTGDLERAARKQFTQDVTPGFVYLLAAFSALGGFMFGYDTGVISGAMLLLKREMELSALWQELLISSTVAAAALSALLGGFLNGLFGRRVCILLASFFFAVGGIVLSTAPGKEVLLAGRLIVGVGLGKTRVRLFNACLNIFSQFGNNFKAVIHTDTSAMSLKLLLIGKQWLICNTDPQVILYGFLHSHSPCTCFPSESSKVRIILSAP